MNPKTLEERLEGVVQRAFPEDWRTLPAVGVAGEGADLPQAPVEVRAHEEPAETVWRYVQAALLTTPHFVLLGVHQTEGSSAGDDRRVVP